MASFPRTPKQLKSAGSSTKGGEVSELQASLDRLQSLSKDEPSENALLRSRIDQQSELIMMLKQRADDCQKQLTTMEEAKLKIDNALDQAKKSIQVERERRMVTEKRYNQLHTNYDSICKDKEQYSRDNDHLRQENERLIDENRTLFSTAIREKEDTIERLSNELQEITANYEYTREEMKNLKIISNHAEEELKHQLDDLREKYNTLQDYLETYDKQMKTEKQNYYYEIQSMQEQLDKFKRDKDELTDLAMKRGKLIQEKQDELLNIQKRLDHSHQALRDMELKFKRDAEAVSTNLQIVKLRNQVDDKERKLTKFRQEFDAYKKYTANMLKKERDINAKLRNLVDC